MRKITFLLASLVTWVGLSAQVVTNDQGKCGYQNEAGDLIIPYNYDFIGEFNEHDVALVKSGKKWGMISRTGELKLPVKYDEIGLFNQGLASLVSGKKYGMVNAKGEITCKPEFEFIYQPNSDGIRIALKKKNKKAEKQFDALSTYAILNKEGKIIIPTSPGSSIGTYVDGLTIPQKIATFGSVAAASTSSVPLAMPEGQDTLDTRAGYLSLQTAKTNTLYDLEGNVVLDDTHRNAILQEIYGPKAKVGNKPAYTAQMDMKPEDGIISFVYYQKGASGSANMAYGYYDIKAHKLLKHYTSTATKGKGILAGYTPDETIALMPFSEGFGVATVNQTGNARTELININGDVVATFPVGGCCPYKHGYAVAMNNNRKWGLIDLQQQPVIPYRFDGVANAVNGKEGNLFLCAQENNKWGSVNLKGEVIVPFAYDDITSFIGSDATFVTQNRRLGVFNGAKQILPCDFDSIQHFCDEAFVCFRGNDASVYSIPAAKMSEKCNGFNGVYDASDEFHNGSFWEMYRIENGTDTVYGYIDGKADIVIPFIFNNDVSAHKAYKIYCDMPTQQFGELELYRLRLQFTVRERTYKLDGIVPDNHWDY